MLYPPGMRAVAQHLHAHPDGVSPHMATRDSHPGGAFTAAERINNQNLNWFNHVASQGADADYVEACGDTGDVFLLHPLMLHSATNNAKRNFRVITNPPVSLREPMRFYRGKGEGEYSLVERATLRMLGREAEGLPGWKIERPREAVVPARLRIQEEMKRQELKRLEEEKRRAAGAGVVA